MKPIETIQTLKKKQPDFVARIRFLMIEEGDRKGLAVSGYRPPFRLPDQTEMTSLEQKFRGTDQDITMIDKLTVAEGTYLPQTGFLNNQTSRV